jgi:D-sedoheptulose 7-phosphate isomerase
MDEAKSYKGAPLATEDGSELPSDGAGFGAVVEELQGVLRAFFRERGGVFEAAVQAVAGALEAGGKILLFGNGGSAAEAQHFAAEMVNKLVRDRRALPALAMTTDTSCLTAIGNDTGFERVFSRQIEALARKGDVGIALTTSGTSANVIEGLKSARATGLLTVALTGEETRSVAGLADHILDVPSRTAPRIQEVHLVILHLLAEALEERLALLA